MKKKPAQPEERFGHIPTNNQVKRTNVLTLDPVDVNPNSYKSLIEVLRAIRLKADIIMYGGKTRYWVIIYCDGLPHSLILNLIESFYVCQICKAEVLGSDEIQKHIDEFHKGEQVDFLREFSWILLKSGGGHYESNLLKSFYELNWIPFMSKLCSIWGFETEPAQKTAKACHDHHKSIQMLQLLHIGTLLQLVEPYVLECKDNNLIPTPEDYLYRYAPQRETEPNYKYMLEQVCTYAQGIFSYHAGTRRNNSKLIEDEQLITSPLFHGRSHGKYQDIEMYEGRNYAF